MTTSLERLFTLLDPNNKDFSNGLQERVWSLRPIKNPKEKYLIVFPAGSYTVLLESDEVAESLNVKLSEPQLKEIEKKIFEDRKKGCVVQVPMLLEWANKYQTLYEPSDQIVAGTLGDSRIDLILLVKVIQALGGEELCIYPPPTSGSDKPYILEGLDFRAVIAPIYKKSVVKTVTDGFNLILEDMPGGYKAFVNNGKKARINFITPESLWKEYFSSILNK
jgi:hypothetical protein